ncbi:MAG: chemotaxis protein CheA [Burkholderiaceae bacterium]|jgi:two-component system chemotaxis sensor kinase CheA
MSMISDDLMHDFLQEAGDLLEDVDNKLIELERSPKDAELLNAVFRGFHTIKGGAGFLEAHALVEVCHKGENLLDLLRNGKLTLNEAMMDAILAATGVVQRMFATMRAGGTPEPAEPGVLQALVDCIENKPAAAKIASVAVPAVGETDWESLFRAVSGSGLDPESRIEVQKATPLATASTAAEPARAAPAAQASVESLRVDIGRFDQILNLTGEIGLAKNRLLNLQRKLGAEIGDSVTLKTMEGTLRNLNTLVSDLQNAVMKARMQQVGRVFQKYVRMARDLGRQLGKNIELVLEGADTELDKTLLDELNDPLVHLIRNAVDHGSEPTEVRRAAGKPEKATLRLAARQVGDTVVIEIADDGAGIDAAVLRRKAVEKGLLSAHDASLLNEQRSFELIFLPGFSTKAEVSNISGRGVGMDVVRTNVERLSGRIRIDSEVGQGTRISIILPLTLAILPVLKVRLGEQVFALPLTAVRELIDLDVTLTEHGALPASLSLEGVEMPLVTLSGLLGWKSNVRPSVGIAVQVGLHQVIIAADSFVGRDDVVIKPIQAFKPRGVAGATLSADGEVVLILDLNRLLDPGDDA